MAIKGVINPSTNSDVIHCADFEDGDSVEGETRITLVRKKIRKISKIPPDAKPLDGALEAIAAADIITLGPGSLYTSLSPNLLVERIVDAIQRSPARKIYIQNIMTQPGETTGLSVADHVEALVCHSGGRPLFSRILVNNAIPSPQLLARYQAEGAALVTIDRERLKSMELECMEYGLLAEDGVIRHDPDLLARAVYGIAEI
jgi:uncharacterized cofD-like protein